MANHSLLPWRYDPGPTGSTSARGGRRTTASAGDLADGSTSLTTGGEPRGLVVPSLKNLRTLKILLPSTEEQDAIVAALDAHDARIRTGEAELAKLRQVKRGLMDDLLAG